MGCALWLFFARSTSTTFPLDRPPFVGSDPPVPKAGFCIQNDQMTEILLLLEYGISSDQICDLLFLLVWYKASHCPTKKKKTLNRFLATLKNVFKTFLCL